MVSARVRPADVRYVVTSRMRYVLSPVPWKRHSFPAAALEPVVRALRAGSDATLPLLRARRAFTGAAVRAVPGLPAWSEAW